jgi:hypothetical protein
LRQALCFQQHSRVVSSLFEIIRVSYFTDADDILSSAVVRVIGPDSSGHSQTDQRASNRRQAAPTRSRAIHNS